MLRSDSGKVFVPKALGTRPADQMVTLHDSLVSSSARKLSVVQAARPGRRRQHYLGRSYWVVKDPLGLQYFRFQEEEFAILQMLDGFHEAWTKSRIALKPSFLLQKITLEELRSPWACCTAADW